MPKFGNKTALFGYFWARSLKNYCHIWNQLLRICLFARFRKKTKMPKLRTKNALFGYFWQKMPYLGSSGLGFFKKILWYWKSAPLKFVYSQNFAKKKQKCLNLGPKMSYLGIIGLENLRNYCHVWSKHSRICQKWVFNSYSEFWYRVHFF